MGQSLTKKIEKCCITTALCGTIYSRPDKCIYKERARNVHWRSIWKKFTASALFKLSWAFITSAYYC